MAKSRKNISPNRLTGSDFIEDDTIIGNKQLSTSTQSTTEHRTAMGTKCYIGIKIDDNQYYAVSACYGHPDAVGVLLMDHYQDLEEAEALINLGSISCLGKSLEETVFFVRDKKEKPSVYMEPATMTMKEMIDDSDFVYTQDDGDWLCSNDSFSCKSIQGAINWCNKNRI